MNFGAISAQFNKQSLFRTWAKYFFSQFFFLFGRFILSAKNSTRYYVGNRHSRLYVVVSSKSISPSVRLCWCRYDRTLLLADTIKAGVVSSVVSFVQVLCRQFPDKRKRDA